jgi:hypothetical protein
VQRAEAAGVQALSYGDAAEPVLLCLRSRDQTMLRGGHCRE